MIARGYSYKGTMQFKRYDAKGRPIVHTTPFEVEWGIASRQTGLEGSITQQYDIGCGA